MVNCMLHCPPMHIMLNSMYSAMRRWTLSIIVMYIMHHILHWSIGMYLIISKPALIMWLIFAVKIPILSAWMVAVTWHGLMAHRLWPLIYFRIMYNINNFSDSSEFFSYEWCFCMTWIDTIIKANELCPLNVCKNHDNYLVWGWKRIWSLININYRN